MNTVNLVVQYKKEPDNVHSEFVDIMEYFDGSESTINANGETESIRYYWYGIKKEGEKLNAIVRKLAANGVQFKLLPRGYGNYSFSQ